MADDPRQIHQLPAATLPLADADLAAVSQSGVTGYAPLGGIRGGARAMIQASDWGVLGDGVEKLGAGAITASDATLTVTGGSFTAADVGKVIAVTDAGSSRPLRTTIASYTSATEVELTDTASTTVSNVDVVYGTDNTTPLLAIRTHMESIRGRPITLQMPSGLVLYDDNRWLALCDFVDIHGDNTTLCCVFGGIDSRRDIPITVSNIFEKNVLTSYVNINGDRFDTANAGVRTVTMTTTGDAANYTVGDRVFLYSFEQQFSGYPPNQRYFEWNVVEGVNTGTGVLTLRSPLRFTHDDGVKDVADYIGAGLDIGKPRIIRLVQTDAYYPQQLRFYNLTWRLNPAQPTSISNAVTAPCEHLEFHNCVFPNQLWPSEHRFVGYYHCKVDTTDIDKLVDVCLFEDCTITGVLTAATGVNHLILRRCLMTDSGSGGSAGHQVAPRRLTFEDCTIIMENSGWAIITQFPVQHPIETVTLKGNRFIDLKGTPVNPIIDLNSHLNVTLAGATGQEMHITDDATGRLNIAKIAIGTVMGKLDGSNVGYVTRIYHDGTVFRLAGTWPNAPATSEVYHYFTMKRLIDAGGNTKNVPTSTWFQASTNGFCWRGADDGNFRGGLHEIRLRHDDINWAGDPTFPIAGEIVEAEVHILKPYTGTQVSPNMQLRRAPDDVYGNRVTFAQVRLTSAGRRVINEFAASGSRTSDDLSGFANIAGWAQYVAFEITSMSDIADLAVRPELEVIIRVRHRGIAP